MSLIRKFVSKIRGRKKPYAPSIRFAVIRPHRSFASEEFKAAVEKGMSSDEFQRRAHDALQDGGTLVGFLVAGSPTLVSVDGVTPSNYSLQSGDIIDEIEEFERAMNSGAYQRVA